MSEDRRRIPHDSLEEAQIAESLLVGVLWGLLMTNEHVIKERINYLGCDVVTADDPQPNIVYSHLVMHMRSGDYEVTVRKVS